MKAFDSMMMILWWRTFLPL